MGIQFNQVGYGYRGFKKVYHALKDINLDIAETGEFVAITGQTGSGKSTLVQHMNALLKPTSGTVDILGTILPSKKKTKVNHLDRKSTRLNSSHVKISYSVFCLKKKIDI